MVAQTGLKKDNLHILEPSARVDYFPLSVQNALLNNYVILGENLREQRDFMFKIINI